MANFLKAHKHIYKAEGGYTNNPNDSGNYVDGELIGTNYGISAPVLKSYLGRTPSVSDMINLKYSDALKIYKHEYWDRINGDNIKNQDVALLIYDGAVNQGLGAIKRMVDKSLARQGKLFDNFSKDIKSINNSNQRKLFNDIWQERYSSYSKGQAEFRQGWISRLEDIKYGNRTGLYIILGLSLIFATTGFIYYKKLTK